MILAYYMTSTKVPWKLSVWYDNYVEMLYKTIINEPPYTPDEVNEQVTKWLTANMPPLYLGTRPLIVQLSMRTCNILTLQRQTT
jgi:hypothetical protein